MAHFKRVYHVIDNTDGTTRAMYSTRKAAQEHVDMMAGIIECHVMVEKVITKGRNGRW